MAVRTLWQVPRFARSHRPSPKASRCSTWCASSAPLWDRRRSGKALAFSAKQLLEVDVMLLGASVSFAAIAASETLLIGLIVAVIVDMITLSLVISRALSLPVRMSIMASSRHAHATEVSRDIACRGRTRMEFDSREVDPIVWILPRPAHALDHVARRKRETVNQVSHRHRLSAVADRSALV